MLLCPQNKSGIRILDADPSIRCDEVWPAHRIRAPTRVPVRVPTLNPLRPPCSVSCPAVVLVALQAGGVQMRLKPAAALSLAGYAVGLPLTFLLLLVRHRGSILADQALKVAGLGGTEATNPYFHIRMQFQELYRCGDGAPLLHFLCGPDGSRRTFVRCGRVNSLC